MWNKLVVSISNFSFWVYYFLSVCLAYSTIVGYTVGMEYVPNAFLWLSTIALGMAVLSGTVPVICIGTQIIFKKVSK